MLKLIKDSQSTNIFYLIKNFVNANIILQNTTYYFGNMRSQSAPQMFIYTRGAPMCSLSWMTNYATATIFQMIFLFSNWQKTVGVNTSKVRCGHLQITITPLPLTKVLYNLAFVILVSFTVLSIILKKKKIKFLCLQGRRKEKHSHSHRGIHSPFFTDSHTHNIYLVFTNKVVLFCLKQSVVSLTHNASLVFSFDFGNIGLCKNNYWWKPERNMHSLKTRISSSKLEKGESWLILLKILT